MNRTLMQLRSLLFRSGTKRAEWLKKKRIFGDPYTVSVIATKGNPAYDSIGKGTFYSTCGAVFIEDPSKVTEN